MKKIIKNPKVQILLATYNGEKFLGQQLDSIVNQEYNSWELLIHDDGSDDNTIKILNEYQIKYSKNIKLLKDKKLSPVRVKNFFT